MSTLNTQNKPGRVRSSLLAATMILGLGAGLQGCTDEEVATGVGLIAIGAGAAIIADGARDGRGHYNNPGYGHGGGRGGYYACQGGYERRCSNYRDYYGYTRSECRNVWNSCLNRRWVSNGYGRYSNDLASLETFELNSDTLKASSTSSIQNQKADSGVWATTFNLSFDGAQKLTSALEDSRKGDVQALYKLGLSGSDVRALAQERMPSSKGLDQLAQSLNQEKSETRKMLRQMIKKGREVKKQECLKAGRSIQACRNA